MRVLLLIAGAWLGATLPLLAADRTTPPQALPGASVSKLALRDMRGHMTEHALKGEITVVMFFSTRCPISNAFNFRRNQLYNDFNGRVRFIVIDPNASESLGEVRQYAHDVGFDFPVYRDDNNVVADRFRVKATTDTFVVDPTGVIRYRGYLEDSPNASRAKDPALRHAIDDLLAKRPVQQPETRAIGCAIRRVKP